MLQEFDENDLADVETQLQPELQLLDARQEQLSPVLLLASPRSPLVKQETSDSIDVVDVAESITEVVPDDDLLGRSPANLLEMPPPGIVIAVPHVTAAPTLDLSPDDAADVCLEDGCGVEIAPDKIDVPLSPPESTADTEEVAPSVHGTSHGFVHHAADVEDELENADCDLSSGDGGIAEITDLNVAADDDEDLSEGAANEDLTPSHPFRRGHKRVGGRAVMISSNTSFVSVNLSQQATATIVEPADAAAVQRFRLDVLNLADYHPEMASRVRVTCNGLPLGITVEASNKDSLVPGMVVVHIAPNGAVSKQGLINVGDLLLKVNGQSLVCLPEKRVAAILKAAARLAEVDLEVIVQDTAFDVDMTRASPDEELGFTISEAVVDSIRPQSLADRAHLQLGHKIISVNRESTAGWTDDQILAALGTTFEVRLQTMPLHVWDALFARASRASGLSQLAKVATAAKA